MFGNFRNLCPSVVGKPERIKYAAHKTNKAAKTPTVDKKRSFLPQTIVGWFWSALLGAISLAGEWAVVKPVVHVEPYIQLDPSSPFSERFKVSNDGLFAIYDVDYSCRVISAVTGNHE